MTATHESPRPSAVIGTGSPEVGDLSVDELRHEVHHLRRALASRPVIDQAKGALMLRYGLSADEAFDVLRRWSGRHEITVRSLAELVVRSLGALDADGPGVDHHLSALALRARADPSA